MKNLNEDSIKELLLSENLEDQVLACTIMRKNFTRKKCQEILESLGTNSRIESHSPEYYVIKKKNSWGFCTYSYIEIEDKDRISIWDKEDPDLTIIEL